MFATPEFKVGALVIIISGLIGFMSLKVAEGPGVFSGSNDYWFELDSASGLVKNSAVKVAGIKVGTIKEIELVNGKARVHVLLEGDVPITTSGQVEIRADGILGDKHVEIISGNASDPPLKSGSQIVTAGQKGSLDSIMKKIGDVADNLSEVAKTFKEASQGDGDNTTPIGRIVLNIEKLTKDLADISGKNKGKINDIVEQINDITKTLDDVINSSDPEKGFRASWDKLDSSLKNIEQITNKINSGEGTIGRLVNDEETVEGINQAIENVNDFLGGAGEMQTSIDYHSEFMARSSESKSYLSVVIQPGLDRYYELGLVDDAKGLTRIVETETSVGGGPAVKTREVRHRRSSLKFTALFAKNFYDFTVKGGIMESAGGVGVDYYLFNRRLRFSLEAFNPRNLYLRTFVKYNFIRGFYLVGGLDDLIAKGDDPARESSGFIGAGIFITNDDLKMLASKVAF